MGLCHKGHKTITVSDHNHTVSVWDDIAIALIMEKENLLLLK